MEVAKRVSKSGEQNVLQRVQQALSGLRYGSILITVQDAKVVQIDRTEKIRLANNEK